MCDASPHHWQRWRVTLATNAPAPGTDLPNRLRAVLGVPTPPATVPADAGRDEQPGPDGIRHELVARVRREIAAGTYDTEEKWLAAEAELLRRIEERM